MNLAVAILVLAATTAAADTPSIDEAIAQAARDKKLIVLEVGAVWCKPCVWFEKNVLPDPNVSAALTRVAFVRYDVDTPLGSEVATRYRVNGFPTFLVLDPQGSETFRATGFPGNNAVGWFLELLRTGRSTKSPVEELRAAVTANPNDCRLRLRLAHVLHESGRDDEAKAEYATVLTSETVDAVATAEAEAALEEMEGARRRIEAVISDAKSFVTKHPASPLTSRRLALLVMARGIDTAALDGALIEHLAKVRPVDRPDALRVALLAGRPLIARAAFGGWAQDPTTAALMRAEIAIDAKKSDDAKRLAATACKDTPAGFERWCFEIISAIRTGSVMVPGVERMRFDAVRILSDLREPGAVSASSLWSVDPEVGNAISRALFAADRKCGALAGKTARAYLQIDLAPQGGTPRDVHVRVDDGRLATCIRGVVGGTRYPVAPGGPQIVTGLVFESAQRTFRDIEAPPSERIAAGAVIGLTGRMGSVDSTGFAIDALFDITRVSSYRLVTSFALEAGISQSEENEKLDAVYASRLLLGFAYAPTSSVMVELAAGAGASKYGPDMPSAFEVPAQLRLRIARGRLRIHTWARATYLFGSSSREPATTYALASSDEMAFGLALAGPVLGKDVFTGLVYEDRKIGTSALVVVGIPIGGFF